MSPEFIILVLNLKLIIMIGIGEISVILLVWGLLFPKKLKQTAVAIYNYCKSNK